MRCLGTFPRVALSTKNIEFGKLLLNQRSTQSLVITNKCKIRVKWKLLGVDDLTDEFSIKNTSGELDPTEHADVSIEFRAIK